MPPGGLNHQNGSMLSRRKDLILPVGIIASVLVIMVPLPPALMDLLLALNITVAVIMLLTTIYVRTPLEFSIFPSLLLATTLGRLVLNVATTRLILTRAETQGLGAAGDVIRTFGEFVAGDKIAVGLIIFIIIILIQFVVITKGATRISEVAARFALDGMPGKQMAIDADLNAGIIDEHEAQRRRGEITQQADFFGAMDGASKFVRGDAIAGIVITVVNVIGGLFIGVMDAGMSLGEAGALFTKLTIGDGLVSQVPAFLVSLAAALLVTRSSNDTNLPIQFLSQLFSRPQALAVAGGFLGVLVFTSLPTAPLLLIGGGCVGLAITLSRRERDEERAAEAKEQEAAAPETEERVEDHLLVDPMELEVGVGLIRLASPGQGGSLLESIHLIRQEVASSVGLLMPKVRIRDSVHLDSNQYRIKIADMPVADGVVMPQKLLAIDMGMTTGRVQGLETLDPAYGMPAVWIDPGQRDQASLAGYMLAEPVTVLSTHLKQVVIEHADEILSRDETKKLIDELHRTSPAVVDELIPKQMSLAEVQQVLQMLLREGVPIRQLGAILETLGDYATPGSNDLVSLAEHVRTRLARAICTRYRDEHKRLKVVTLDPALADRISAGVERSDRGLHIRMSPDAIRATAEQVRQTVERHKAKHRNLVLLVSPALREHEGDFDVRSAEAAGAELQRDHARHDRRVAGRRAGGFVRLTCVLQAPRPTDQI